MLQSIKTSNMELTEEREKFAGKAQNLNWGDLAKMKIPTFSAQKVVLFDYVVLGSIFGCTKKGEHL